MQKISALLVVLLAACAPATSSTSSAGPVRQTTSVTTGGGANVDLVSYADDRPSSHALQAAPDQVWAILPAVFEQIRIKPETVDPAARLIGNRRIVANGRIAGARASDFLECGSSVSGPIADSYQVNLALTTEVVPAEAGGSELRTSMQATASQRGVSSVPVRCATTGRLESRIAALVRQQLGVR